MSVLTGDAWRIFPPCEHEWRECYKHADNSHQECDLCGALLYPEATE